jgi:hypothetical protein
MPLKSDRLKRKNESLDGGGDGGRTFQMEGPATANRQFGQEHS